MDDADGYFGERVAASYDDPTSQEFDPAVVAATVDVLAGLAGPGRALEFAVGTGRIALPLVARGVPVHGIDMSRAMVARLCAKPGGDAIGVTFGDFATTRVPGTFALVYLVWNSLMNVTTQDEQVAVFANAAAHLSDEGCFVVEIMVPQLRAVPPGGRGRVFTLEPDHVGVETFDDEVGQISWSHHWMTVEDKLVTHSAPYRYVWPSELDLMAQMAGLRLRDRWDGWTGRPFTSESRQHVSLWEKPAR